MNRAYALATAILLALTVSVTHAAERWAIIFAPGDYQSIADGTYHQAGAERLRSQLLKSGFCEEQIQFPATSSAEANGPATAKSLETSSSNTTSKLGRDDLLLVAIASYGVYSDDRDYVCDATATDEAIASSNPAMCPHR